MDSQFSFREIWLIFFGFGYLVNHRNKEIHRVNEKRHNCHLERISSKTSEYVTRRTAIRLIKTRGYNGCRWCWEEQDKG